MGARGPEARLELGLSERSSVRRGKDQHTAGSNRDAVLLFLETSTQKNARRVIGKVHGDRDCPCPIDSTTCFRKCSHLCLSGHEVDADRMISEARGVDRARTGRAT